MTIQQTVNQSQSPDKPTAGDPLGVYRVEVSLGKLHDIPQSDIRSIYVRVGRRNEAGAGMFGGVELLNAETSLTNYEFRDRAMAFIDNIHSWGLIYATKCELARESKPSADGFTAEQVVKELAYGPGENLTCQEYLNTVNVDDPMNVYIRPVIETPTHPDKMGVFDKELGYRILHSNT